MDTGFGMDKATQDRIFEPFYTTKERGQGTGLGLASAYGIIKGHEGFIDVISKPGSGTTFSIFLPVSGKKISVKQEAPRGVVQGSGMILLVDDEAMVLDVGLQMIQKLGYQVITATSGQEAVDIYRAQKDAIDMVILDMVMPNGGGSKTYDHLKAIQPEVKILLSSGYSLDGQASRILERGCNGFIQKPFSIDSLSVKISEIIS
jgi:CheY-like chemotaxis protein